MTKAKEVPKQAPKLRVGKVSEFRPQTENANKHTPKGLGALRKAMQTSGYVAPVTATADREVIDGSARIETAFDAFADEAIILEHDGTRSIIAVRTDIKSAKSAKAKRIAIEANRIAQIDLDWDVDVLSDMPADVLEGLFDADDLASMGLDAGAEAEGADAEPQIDRAEELRAKWQTEPGQLWRIGEHRLLCGDSTRREDVERVMGGERADAVVTDPPYGMKAVSSSGVLKKKYRQDIAGDENSDAAVNAFVFCRTFDVPQIWWGANYYTQCLPANGCWLVWDKNNGASDQADAELAWTNLPGVVRIFKQASEKADRVHPTQKHPRLIAWCIEKCGPAAIVYEPFAGSGTTIVACQQLGRKCRAIEISPAYVAVILERMKTAFPELKIEKVKA